MHWDVIHLQALNNCQILLNVNIKYIFIASYYRQLSTVIKIKNYKTKTYFISPYGLCFDALHDLPVWMRTGSNPADSKYFLIVFLELTFYIQKDSL